MKDDRLAADKRERARLISTLSEGAEEICIRANDDWQVFVLDRAQNKCAAGRRSRRSFLQGERAARFKDACDDVDYAGARHLFARAKCGVREERKKTITHEPCNIRAIACRDINGITKREQVFHVSIIEQRVCACFTENGGG